MSYDTTELMGMEQLHFMHLGRAWRNQWIRLRQQTHGGVVEKACNNRGALDKPVRHRSVMIDPATVSPMTYQTSGNADFEFV
jgi:hypothetical protein